MMKSINSMELAGDKSTYTPALRTTVAENDLIGLNGRLHVLIFLNKTDAALEFLQAHEGVAGQILDCNLVIRCPLETALHRKNFDLASVILDLMKKNLKYGHISDLFIKNHIPFLRQLVESGNKEAIKFILDECSKEDPDQGYNVRFTGQTAVQIAKKCKSYESYEDIMSVTKYLVEELGCNDESVSASLSSASSSESHVLRSNCTPKPKRRRSIPKFHFDVHIRSSTSRSSSISPKGSTIALSAPESPKSKASSTNSSPRNFSSDPDETFSGSEDSTIRSSSLKDKLRPRRLSSSPRIIFSRNKESKEAKKSRESSDENESKEMKKKLVEDPDKNRKLKEGSEELNDERKESKDDPNDTA